MTSAAMSAATHQRGLSPMQGSVLIVDDEEGIRNLFVELFRRERVHVRVAGSGQEAISMVRQMTPALLIVDVLLPDGDGIAVLEEAQKIDNRIIGVVMTGAATVELAVRAIKAGAIEFLMKPFQSEAVIAVVRRLLEVHRLRTANTVVKHAAVRSGAVRLQNVPLHTFEEGAAVRGEDGQAEYERGLADGRQLAEEERRQDLTVLTEAARRFDAARAQLRQTMEDDVIALAFQVSSKVLRELAESCRELIIVQARAALSAVRDAASVVIQAHPQDAAVLEAARAELIGLRDVALTIIVEARPTLPRGTCLLHTDTRLVDASVETQLVRLGDTLQNRPYRESSSAY